MTEANFNAAAEADGGYGQLFAILIRRRLWFLNIFFAVLSAAGIYTVKAKPTYQSSMQLLVEQNYQAKKGEAGQPNQFADSNIEIDAATQLNLMRSSDLIQQALNLLSSDYSDLNVEDIKKTLNVAQLEEDKIQTKIFEVAYKDNDPVKTQKVLKAFQKVYQDYNREQQKMRLNKGLAFIDAQLPALREKVVESEAALEEFRKRQNLLEPELQAKTLTDALSIVEQDLQKIRTQYEDAQARYAALQQQIGSSPQQALSSSRLSESARYQAMLNEIQKTELTIQEERRRFTESHPFIQELVAQRQRQIGLLEEEMNRVLGETPAPENLAGNDLLTKGQLGKLDLELAAELVQVRTNLESLKAQEHSLEEKQGQLRAELNRFPSVLAEYNRLQPEVKIKRATLDRLMEARQELALEIARGGFDWQVVEAPQLGLKIGPKLKQNILLGAVVGFMLGGMAAFLREMVDDAVHTSDEMKKQVDLPLLGIAPELPQPKAGELAIASLYFRKQPALPPPTIRAIDWQPFRESLDLIYQNIQLLNSACPFASLLVTSALAGEGKSTLALGLAASAARLHQRVLLIDADLRRPSLHKLLDLPNEQGLSTLLNDEAAAPNQSVQLLDLDANISILTSGPTPTDPAKLLSCRRMGELMAAFEKSYDLVLVDAPPVLGTVDSIIAASFCTGVLVVGRIGRVTRTELAQAIASLSKLNAIGIVANGASSHINNYKSCERNT